MSVARIAFTFDAGTFAVMHALLASEGIPALEIAMGGHVAIAGVDQGFYLQVLDTDVERARSVLVRHQFGKYVLDGR